MKLEDTKEYILIKSETKDESKVLKDIFHHHYPSTITLWVNTEGKIDGMKIWKYFNEKST